jgi:hypothetical protein
MWLPVITTDRDLGNRYGKGALPYKPTERRDPGHLKQERSHAPASGGFGKGQAVRPNPA